MAFKLDQRMTREVVTVLGMTLLISVGLSYQAPDFIFMTMPNGAKTQCYARTGAYALLFSLLIVAGLKYWDKRRM
jgi:hypothetical protein